MTPHTRFLDYGCGGLRMGKLLIPYLDADCYRGIDVTDTFYKAGLKEIPQALIDSKRPVFDVINADTLARMRSFDAQMIYVGGVLHHVPPWELQRFLREVASVIGPSGQCLIMNRSGPHKKRLGLMRWAYDPEKLSRSLARWGVGIVNTMSDPVPPMTDPGTRNEILIVERLPRN